MTERPQRFDNGRLDAGEREELLGIFLAGCRWPRICCGWRPNRPDEGDSHLIELASAGSASHIAYP